MAEARHVIGLVGELVQPVTRWGTPRWYARAALAEAPEAAPGTALGGGLVYLGAAELGFHRVETGTYRDNLVTGSPRLWVVLQLAPDPAGLPAIVTVTADPAEGEAFTEAGIDLSERVVETVDLPAPLAAALAAFVEEHHVERGFHKRRRDRADPEALGRRRPEDLSE